MVMGALLSDRHYNLSDTKAEPRPNPIRLRSELSCRAPFRVSDVDFASVALLGYPGAVPAHDRPNHLALSHHREAWRRGNGGGLQGRRYPVAPLRSLEVSSFRSGARSAIPGAFPARSAGSLGA